MFPPALTIILSLLPPTLAATPLRILPAGASVTFGVGSTTGNSYRLSLRDLLISPPANHSVNYVGTRRNGDFPDNEVEATSGFVLAQIAAAATAAAKQFLPNLVLIEAGTNNCNIGRPVPDAGKNLTELVREVFRLSPGSTVIAATLLVNTVAAQDACRVDVNKQYVDAAKALEGEGARFVLVDMRGEGTPTTKDLADGRHPNDKGYALMAGVWKRGIDEALRRGFVTPPAENRIPLDGNTQALRSGGAMAMSAVAENRGVGMLGVGGWVVCLAVGLSLGTLHIV